MVLTHGSALAAFALVVVVLISHYGLITWQQSEQMRHDLLSSADFEVRFDFFITMWNSMASNMQDLGRFYLREHWPWEEQLLGLLLFGPAAVMIMRVVWRALGAGLLAVKTDRRTAQWMKVVTVVVLLTPLLMNVLGWDIIRWDAFAVINAMLVLAVLSRALPLFELTLSAAEKNVILVTIALGMVSGYGLFDHEQARLYPFYPSVRPSWAGRF
jgi:hypothetical protein